MNPSRTVNIIRSIFWGIVNKFIIVLFPFFIRTIILKMLGAEYLGLGGLFSALLQVLSLAELGFGVAITFNMYKPIAEEDTDMVCALLNIYKKYYRIIGIIIFTVGLVFMPFIKHLINGSYPVEINLYVLYGIYLLNTVSSYFLYAYKASLFSANQREDITNNISSIVNIFLYAVQTVVLLKFKNYYTYIILMPIATIVNNLLNAYKVKMMFPHYICRGELNKEKTQKIARQVRALIGHKIEAVIILSADNIVISAFLGLTVLAIYNNYYYIVATLVTFLTVFFNAVRPSIGNSMVMESVEKNYNDFKKIVFIVAWIAGWCSVCLICLYQQFITLWIGENYLLSMSTVILLAVYFYGWKMIDTLDVFKTAAGMYEVDKFRPYITATLNIVLNIILVQHIGLNGVILSTVGTLIGISFPWIMKVLFRDYFNRSPITYIKRLFMFSIVVFGNALITYFLCSKFTGGGVSSFLIKIVICCIIPNVIWIVLFHRTAEFREIIRMIKGFYIKLKEKKSI